MNEITQLAYRMEKEYKARRSQGEAVEAVKNMYPDANLDILWAMWAAIDAYVDINT